jgi:hypothetical protein
MGCHQGDFPQRETFCGQKAQISLSYAAQTKTRGFFRCQTSNFDQFSTKEFGRLVLGYRFSESIQQKWDSSLGTELILAENIRYIHRFWVWEAATSCYPHKFCITPEEALVYRHDVVFVGGVTLFCSFSTSIGPR